MSAIQAMSEFRTLRFSSALVWTALAASLAGLALATYLAFENVQGQSGVCTGVAHSCVKVQQSRYGKVFGVPVSVPGAALYGVLALAAIAWLTDFRGWRPVATFVAFIGALAGFLFSAYLTSTEAFLLDAWCVYCVTSALLMTLLFVAWSTMFWRESRDA
jgi:uncharacterized membrane protein